MAVPTTFYSQQASLLPQGLQSLMASGQLNPMPMAQAMQQQQPAIQQFQAQQQGLGLQQQQAAMQQAPDYNQMARMAAPIYTPPPAPPPAPVAAPQQQVTQRQQMVRPWQGSAINRLETQ